MKKLRLLTCCFTVLFIVQVRHGYAQLKKDSLSIQAKEPVWVHDDMTQPQFPGGPKGLIEYLRQNVRYPEVAESKKVKGKVWASFVIDTAGYVSDIRIMKGIGYGCDEEAMRVVKAMPRWIPGTQSGRAMRVLYNLPVLFGMDYPKVRVR